MYVARGDKTTSVERQAAWEIAGGLQAIDGLKPTPYAQDAAAEYIAGRIDYQQVEQRLVDYHATTANAADREADLTAARIMRIIGEPDLTLNPGYFASIHGRIFEGILPDRRWEGRFRSEDISKPEPVLGGMSVSYTAASSIIETLRWEFDAERDRDFVPRDDLDAALHVMDFMSSVWQVHPFREGNTRTTATFAVKYLRDLGVEIDNDPFHHNSVLFRDALVLDNAPRGLRNREPLRAFARALVGAGPMPPSLRDEA